MNGNTVRFVLLTSLSAGLLSCKSSTSSSPYAGLWRSFAVNACNLGSFTVAPNGTFSAGPGPSGVLGNDGIGDCGHLFVTSKISSAGDVTGTLKVSASPYTLTGSCTTDSLCSGTVPDHLGSFTGAPAIFGMVR